LEEGTSGTPVLACASFGCENVIRYAISLESVGASFPNPNVGTGSWIWLGVVLHGNRRFAIGNGSWIWLSDLGTEHYD
jgi:hypothetical protein